MPGKLPWKLVASMHSGVCKPPPLSKHPQYSRLAKGYWPERVQPEGWRPSNGPPGARRPISPKIPGNEDRPRHLTSRPHGRPPNFLPRIFAMHRRTFSPGTPALQTTIMAGQPTKLAPGSLCLYESPAQRRPIIAIAIISSGATFNTEGSYPTPGKIN